MCNDSNLMLQPPSDPKLLIAPLQPEKLAKFAITSLERSSKRELMLEPGLGIHISLMDTSDYSVTDPDAQLAPEDLALLDVSFNVSLKYSKSAYKSGLQMQTYSPEMGW